MGKLCPRAKRSLARTVSLNIDRLPFLLPLPRPSTRLFDRPDCEFSFFNGNDTSRGYLRPIFFPRSPPAVPMFQRVVYQSRVKSRSFHLAVLSGSDGFERMENGNVFPCRRGTERARDRAGPGCRGIINESLSWPVRGLGPGETKPLMISICIRLLVRLASRRAPIAKSPVSYVRSWLIFVKPNSRGANKSSRAAASRRPSFVSSSRSLRFPIPLFAALFSADRCNRRRFSVSIPSPRSRDDSTGSKETKLRPVGRYDRRSRSSGNVKRYSEDRPKSTLEILRPAEREGSSNSSSRAKEMGNEKWNLGKSSANRSK